MEAEKSELVHPNTYKKWTRISRYHGHRIGSTAAAYLIGVRKKFLICLSSIALVQHRVLIIRCRLGYSQNNHNNNSTQPWGLGARKSLLLRCYIESLVKDRTFHNEEPDYTSRKDAESSLQPFCYRTSSTY